MLDVEQRAQRIPTSQKSSMASDPPAPSLVASTFVEQYYKTLGSAPQYIHRFYSNDSCFARLEQGAALSFDAASGHTVFGQIAIHDKIRELDYQHCKALIDTIDFQESVDGSIMIQITGLISNKGCPPRPFCQSVLLARQERGYFVRNDILRYLGKSRNDTHSVGATRAPGAAFSEDTSSRETSDSKPEDVQVPENSESSGSGDQFSDANITDDNNESRSETTDAPIVETPAEEYEIERLPSPAPAVEQYPSPVKPTSWASLFTKTTVPTSIPHTSAQAPTAFVATSSSPISQPARSQTNDAWEIKRGQNVVDPSLQVFIQNCPESVTNSDIANSFKCFGNVMRVTLLQKRTSGYVAFDSPESVAAALAAERVSVGGVEVSVTPCKPRHQQAVRGNRGGGRGSARGRYVARGRQLNGKSDN